MPNPQTSEQETKQPQSDDQAKELSDLDVMKEEIKKLKEENKRIRKEELDTRTDPNYIKRVQDDKKKQREARILQQRLPVGKQLTRDQMEGMSNEDIISYVNTSLAQMSQSIQRDKIDPLYESQTEGILEEGLKELNGIDKDWVDLQAEMLPIARANSNLSPVQVYTAALAASGQFDRLDKVRAKMNPPSKEEEEMPREKEATKETPNRPPIVGGEKPSTSVTGIKPPQKRMTAKEAATKAYEEVFEKQGI